MTNEANQFSCVKRKSKRKCNEKKKNQLANSRGHLLTHRHTLILAPLESGHKRFIKKWLTSFSVANAYLPSRHFLSKHRRMHCYDEIPHRHINCFASSSSHVSSCHTDKYNECDAWQRRRPIDTDQLDCTAHLLALLFHKCINFCLAVCILSLIIFRFSPLPLLLLIYQFLLLLFVASTLRLSDVT